MSSIRWIRSIMVNGVPTNLEIMIGSNSIADKCYVRVNAEPEFYFKPPVDSREATVNKGKEILKSRFQGKTLTNLDGEPYTWN
jgi:hypothetical protein